MSGIPRPAARLWLTIALGVLGVPLFHGKTAFFVEPFANISRAAAFAWMAAALAAVLLLHRLEKAKVSKFTLTLMALALALSPAFPTYFPGQARRTAAGVAWACLMCLLTLLAGASASGSQPRSLMRGASVALAAPLLLFASRPVAAGSSARTQALSRAAFVVFPYALAAGFTLTHFGYKFYRNARWPGLACLSFSIWAWLGCTMLFVLSPWPQCYRIRKTEGRTERVLSNAGTAVAMAMVLVVVAASDHRAFWSLIPPRLPDYRALVGRFVGIVGLAWFLIWPLLGGMLFFVLSPWPAYIRVPRLRDLSEERKAGPLATAVFMAMALAPLASFAYGPFMHVITGGIFSGGFDRAHVGSALDQPTIGKWLFLFTMFAGLVFPYVAAARWMGDRRGRTGYWAFAIPAVALCACLLSILAVPCQWLVQYIHDMGFTPRRTYGLIYALCGWIVVLGFLCWALWPPEAQRARRSPEESAA